MLGLRTNRDYLLQALAAPAFAKPEAGHALARRGQPRLAPRVPDARWAAVAAALLLHRRSRVFGPLALFSSSGQRDTPLRLAVGEQSSTCAWPTATASRCG